LKLSSVRELAADELLLESDDFGDVIANHQTMLLRAGKEVRGVHPDFWQRIVFVRKTCKRVYRLKGDHRAGSAASSAFVGGDEVVINFGEEYSRPSSTTGVFHVDRNRVELTVIPQVPDLRDEDEMTQFFNRCWELARQLRSILE